MSAINLSVQLENRTIVANEFPQSDREVPYRIAIVGEAPGADEEAYGKPFIGASGHFLNNLLSNAGILRTSCFVGNVCQIRPPKNEIHRFAWDGHEIQSGLVQLKADLELFKPNLCILLGNTPLTSAMGTTKKISDWRGSLFLCENKTSPFYGYKCMAAFHPAYVLRFYSELPLLMFDLKRGRSEGDSSILHLPQREIYIDLSVEQILARLDNWPTGQECSVDIEGVLGNWTCVSVAAGPSDVFTIDWYDLTEADEIRLMTSFSRLMYRVDVPKTLQNCLYDNFVMAFGYRILMRNVYDDTMLKGWEIYPELPKGLDVQASLWTRQPNWKDELMAYSKKKQDQLKALGIDTKRNKLRGCCIDSAVTSEISRAQQTHLNQPGREKTKQHYRFNMNLLPSLLYMELHGIKYDIPGAQELHRLTSIELAEAKSRLDARTGSFNMVGKTGAFSPQKLSHYLYKVLMLPPQYKKEKGRLTNKLTTDTEAMLTLLRKISENSKIPQSHANIVHEILYIKKRNKLRQYLEVKTDADGRVRCGYNLVGTETGRMSCYESPTGSGTNLTTITKGLRRIYTSDPECDFAQFDLAGADGWTVALHCNRLGDPTMLEDYKYGIKPAQVIALMYTIFQQEVAKQGKATATFKASLIRHLFKFFREISREELKKLCKQVDKEGWLYFGCKRVQHGKNYLLGKDTMSSQILKDSYKFLGEAIFVSPEDCELLGNLYISGRYSAAEKWQKWVESELIKNKSLIGASGHIRKFFGRIMEGPKVCHATLREAVADEPQENTTYVTNLALNRIWTDPENRVLVSNRTHLIIHPLHQVHDALCVQWPKAQRAWAIEKMNSYFHNPVQIAGQEIVIRVEGHFGPNWSGHHFNCPWQKDSKADCTCGEDIGDI